MTNQKKSNNLLENNKCFPWLPWTRQHWLRCICAKRNWCSSGCDIPVRPCSRCTFQTSNLIKITRLSWLNGFQIFGKYIYTFCLNFLYIISIFHFKKKHSKLQSIKKKQEIKLICNENRLETFHALVFIIHVFQMHINYCNYYFWYLYVWHPLPPTKDATRQGIKKETTWVQSKIRYFHLFIHLVLYIFTFIRMYFCDCIPIFFTIDIKKYKR